MYLVIYWIIEFGLYVGWGGGGERPPLAIETRLRRLVGIESRLSGIKRRLGKRDGGQARAKEGYVMPTNFTNRLWPGRRGVAACALQRNCAAMVSKGGSKFRLGHPDLHPTLDADLKRWIRWIRIFGYPHYPDHDSST